MLFNSIILILGLTKVISMNIDYIKENYIFETLSEHHNLNSFECESKDLTDFLKNDALNQQNMNLNLTQLITCDGVIFGFVSILTDSMKLKVVDDEKTKKEIRDKLNISENNEIPAIKIGRFAIDKKYGKKGLGSHILSNVLLSLLNLSKNKIGFRFVLVEAYAIALDFYIKNNFYTLESDEEALEKIDKIKKHNPKQCFNIYLDLKDIQKRIKES